MSIWIIVLLCLFLSGCTSKPKVEEKDTRDLIHLEKYMVGEVVKNKTKIYNLKNGIGSYLGECDNLIDLKYNASEGIYAKLIYLETGNSLNKNKILIENKEDRFEINDFFSAFDMKISLKGSKLAYRYYKSDDLSSINDLSIFDIKDKKKMTLEGDTIISGNLYEFLDEDTLIYYGINPESKERGIFKYSFLTEKEGLLYKVDKGNITGFNIVNNKELFIINTSNESSVLGKIDLKDLTYEKIGGNIESLYSTIDAGENIYYFLIRESNKKTSIYKYDGKNIKKVIYNFPKNISEEYPLVKDKENNVYFIGYDNDKDKRDIYNIKMDGSVNIISSKEAQYRVFREK